MKLPKYPKGLKARIAKEERRVIAKKKVIDRRRSIESDRKKLDALIRKNRV